MELCFQQFTIELLTNKTMKKYNIQSEYYIENEFSALAGPYDMTNKKHVKFFDNVINDMRRGKIEHRVVDCNDKKMIERRGMILPKRK